MNTKIAWHEYGAGEPIVLLHGGHGSHQHWVRNVEALGAHYRVLVPDLPGYGESDVPPEPTMASLVDTLRLALDERIGEGTPIRLVGFSFGGLVAAKMAALRPNVTHLSLLGAAGHGTTRRPKGKLQDWKTALQANDDVALRGVMRHNLLLHMLAHDVSINDEALDIHTSACLKTRFHSKKISHAGGLMEALATAHQVNPAMALSAVWGEHDVTCTPASVLELLESQGALSHKQITLNAGHWVQYEAAKETNAFLLKAMRSPVLTYNPHTTRPALVLPANACDSHVHIFGPAAQFPYAATRNFTPVDAGKETLFALHKTLGISRCVIVQSVVHGFDNSAVEDAIEHGGGRYLGVALVTTSVSDAELQRLASKGFKGVRFHFMNHLAVGSSIDEIVQFTHRLKVVGMHLQVHFESSMIHHIAAPLSKSAVPVVIDHMGRVDSTLGAQHADFSALFELLKNPLFHVKVSGIDRIDSNPASATAFPPYPAGVALAKVLVENYPDQCVWGTDFPHPNHTHVPNDTALVEALSRIACTQVLLDKLLVTNPERLYGFL